MYFDEDVVLDIRMNELDKYIDYFVIIESTFTHSGDKRSLKFNHKKFEKFKDKIIYKVFDKPPKNLENINDNDSEEVKGNKYIMNAIKRENGQRNLIEEGLYNAEKNDIILISDVDEIPNLSKIDFSKVNEKILMFRQDMFYYKFNLKLPGMVWTGTKGCRKKNLLSPQWLRNVKDRNYPLWRIDTIFSKQKYSNIHFIENGGWHFSYLKTAKDIEKKLKSYLHHREYDVDPLGIEKIEQMIKGKKTIYDLRVDMRTPKFKGNHKLRTINFDLLPSYLKKNSGKYKEWLA